MMRDLRRRLERLEATQERLVLLWKGERPADEVMREAFGSAEAPPGVRVFLLCWGENAPS
ncbi:hypothetical protein [Falsiroseomonas oryzae]|uniref:hypothetical protein n=1 Tax=Falsiroseomonas oryzae TaxID=2766473 RepID=UPI0022EB3A12|nr:hypothetical protein [Roseomonas sp. MO-31]